MPGDDPDAPGRLTAHPAADAERLRSELDHYDRSQLWFQVQEIVAERCYLRHGVEVGPGDVVLDVGANVGVAAAFFACVCGVSAVHSFEPVPSSFELLERNVGGLPACRCHPYGLGRFAERVEFTFYRGSAAMASRYADPATDREAVRRAMLALGQAPAEVERGLVGRFDPEQVTVELRPLSAVIAALGIERIDLLKIDVEQAEADVLAGILDADWPLIRQLAAEVHDLDGRLAATVSELRGRGFEVGTEQEPAFRDSPLHMLYAIR